MSSKNVSSTGLGSAGSGSRGRSRALRLVAVVTAAAFVLYGPGMSAAAAVATSPGGSRPRIVGTTAAGLQEFGPVGPSSTRSASGVHADAIPDSASAPYVDGEVLVRYAAGAGRTAASHAAVDAMAGGSSARVLGGVPGLEQVKLKAGVSVTDAIAAYKRQPGVLYAQPNYILRASSLVFPDDPRFSTMWGLHNTGQTGGTSDIDIDAPEAWGITTGSKNVIVAVVDSGVDYNHPDLHANMWTNTAELNGLPGVDDDGNGYVDDIYGIDAVNKDSDPMDDVGHGTHCSGTIGAVGNNSLGVTGVNWNVSIMAVKALGPHGGDDAMAIEAINYATRMGADIISCSWGGGGSNGDALYDAIAASPALFVCAAGNSGKSTDTAPQYPSAYTLDNVISVAAIDDDGALASFSNYGPVSVDLAAPGVDIMSTVPAIHSWAPIAYDDVSSIAGWDLSQYVHNPWSATTARSKSSPSSMGNASYVNNEESWLLYRQPLDLSASDAYQLRFSSWLDLQPDKDYVWVLASTNGSDFYSVARATGDSQGWIDVKLDLADYIGKKNVTFAFVLQSDASGSGAQGYEGAYIDDFGVYASTGSSYTEAYDGTYSGTSMATPHVSGVAALLKAEYPERTASEIKGSIMHNVDPSPALAGKLQTGGRLNAYGALTGTSTVATSIGIKSNVSTTLIGKQALLTGAVTPNDMTGDNIVVYVQKPGKSYWSYSSNRTAYGLGGGAAWLYKYTFKKGMAKGTYRYRAVVPTSAGFFSSTSPNTVSVRLR